MTTISQKIGSQLPGVAKDNDSAATRADRAAAQKAAGMMESLFLRELFKSMRQTVPSEGGLFENSFESQTFSEMFDSTLSEQLGQASTLGLTEQFADQFRAASSSGGSKAQMKLPLTHSVGGASAAGVPARSTPYTGYQPEQLKSFGFDAPRRPEAVAFQDADSKYWSPVPETSVQLDNQYGVRTTPNSPVVAIRSGQVVSADASTLVVQHADGSQSRYEGLGGVQAQPGDLVLRGQMVGLAGSAGNFKLLVAQSGTILQPSAINSLLSK